MPKRSIADLDKDIILEPAQTNDVPIETTMLYANILRALFLGAARIARDRHAAPASWSSTHRCVALGLPCHHRQVPAAADFTTCIA